MFEKGMSVLVTGGAGFIGSLLCPTLLNAGCKVKIIDRLSFGPASLLSFANNANFEVDVGDIRDEPLLDKNLKQCDVIVHLAAIVGFPAVKADPYSAESINVDATKTICKKISKNQKLIFASTGSTYGKVDGICTEETPINPLTLYGSTKAEGEKLCLDVGAVALRFATVFGLSNRMRLDLLINHLVYQAVYEKAVVMFEGGFKRTFLHSRDAVRSIIFAIKNYNAMQGDKFNVGDSSMNFTKLQVAERIKNHVNYLLHEANTGEDLDKRDYEVSYEKIKRLGYSSTVSLDEGIAELVKVCNFVKIPNPYGSVL